MGLLFHDFSTHSNLLPWSDPGPGFLGFKFYFGPWALREVITPLDQEGVIAWDRGHVIVHWYSVNKQGKHPYVYVARGSHACYPRPGKYNVSYQGVSAPGPEDEADTNGDLWGPSSYTLNIVPRLTEIDSNHIDYNYLLFSGIFGKGEGILNRKLGEYPLMSQSPWWLFLTDPDNFINKENNIRYCHKLDPNCDGCIDIGEVMAAIAMWKNGEITIEELIEAISIWKYGTPNRNVALQQNGGTATADSWETYNGYDGMPSNAIDGITDCGTIEDPGGWRGSNIPGWLEVDFDQTYEIENVSIWFGSHQQTYSISLSLDGTSWTEVVQSRLSENIEGFESEVPETFNIDPMLAKYIRVDITTTSAPVAHIFKSSINELEAYANP